MKKCPTNKAGALSPKHQEILEDYSGSLERVKEYDGYNLAEIDRFREDPVINQIFIEYETALFKAIRASLHNHPLVPPEVKALLLEWIITYRRLGDKELLRKMRGMEVGAKRPLTEEQVELINVVRELRLWEKEIETSTETDDNNGSTLGEILQKIRLTRISDNPPAQDKRPRFWTKFTKF